MHGYARPARLITGATIRCTTWRRRAATPSTPTTACASTAPWCTGCTMRACVLSRMWSSTTPMPAAKGRIRISMRSCPATITASTPTAVLKQRRAARTRRPNIKMMEKLIIDTLVLNAREYKIDGFRFDIMSFMFTYNMQHIQHALQALTLEKDGVDGSKIYLYGEGFNFGDTANNQIGPNASQVNLYGFGIGTLQRPHPRRRPRRKSVYRRTRAGLCHGSFHGSEHFHQRQHVAELTAGSAAAILRLDRRWPHRQSARLHVLGQRGRNRYRGEVNYNGQPTGYTKSPIEAVNYASVHDNQDLFDAVQLKSSFTDSIATRARRQIMGMSLVTLGEGIPFFQGGDDLLRSKDMDQNSYNSGDWFNKIDWTGQTANWGIGLPIASQNQGQWPLMTAAAQQSRLHAAAAEHRLQRRSVPGATEASATAQVCSACPRWGRFSRTSLSSTPAQARFRA